MAIERPNIIREKTFSFALQILSLRSLLHKNHEYDISRQVLRSGTAIGAIVREGIDAESKRDFIHKMSMALKETNETAFWLELIIKGKILNNKLVFELSNQCEEIRRILISIIRTSKNKLKAKNY